MIPGLCDPILLSPAKKFLFLIKMGGYPGSCIGQPAISSFPHLLFEEYRKKRKKAGNGYI